MHGYPEAQTILTELQLTLSIFQFCFFLCWLKSQILSFPRGCHQLQLTIYLLKILPNDSNKCLKMESHSLWLGHMLIPELTTMTR